MERIYVLSKEGLPLKPTTRCGRVRHLLKKGEAAVVRRKPFTIQLTYDPLHGRPDPPDSIPTKHVANHTSGRHRSQTRD